VVLRWNIFIRGFYLWLFLILVEGLKFLLRAVTIEVALRCEELGCYLPG